MLVGWNKDASRMPRKDRKYVLLDVGDRGRLASKGGLFLRVCPLSWSKAPDCPRRWEPTSGCSGPQVWVQVPQHTTLQMYTSRVEIFAGKIKPLEDFWTKIDLKISDMWLVKQVPVAHLSPTLVWVTKVRWTDVRCQPPQTMVFSRSTQMDLALVNYHTEIK